LDHAFDLDTDPTLLPASAGVDQRRLDPQARVLDRNLPASVATPPTPREHLESRDSPVASAESSDNRGDVRVATFESSQRIVIARCDQVRDKSRRREDVERRCV